MNTNIQARRITTRRQRDLWNKCQECGRIIPYIDFESGKALNRMITPDSDVSYESWETLCRDHYKPLNNALTKSCETGPQEKLP